MPNFIAIEFDEQKLLVASARSSGRGYQINHLFEIEIDSVATDQDIGTELKKALADRGISKPEILGLVGRQDAEVREMNVPPAPDNEMPDLIRFQARNVFASLNDNWLFDYLPFERVGDEQQRVLAVAIPPHIKERFQAIAEAASQKLKRIIFRPFALCDLFEGLLAGEDNRLLILPVGSRFDVMVTSGSQLVAARSFTVSKDLDAEAVAKHSIGEVRRTIASTKSSLGGHGIRQVIVGGSKEKWPELERELKATLEIPIVFFAPLGCVDPPRFTAPQMPERSEIFAATVGALVKEYSRSNHVVDFLNPRRPVVRKRDYRKVLIPVAALVLLFVVSAAYGWYVLNQQSKTIASKQAELTRQKELNSDTDQLIGEIKALDQWQAGKVNWMDELAFISEKLLTPDDIIISKFRGIETSRGFQIALTSHVSLEQENDSTWHESFGDRYKAPIFDNIDQVEVAEIEDHPVLRPFKLEKEIDLFATIEMVNQAAQEKRITEMDAQSPSNAMNGKEALTTEQEQAE